MKNRENISENMKGIRKKLLGRYIRAMAAVPVVTIAAGVVALIYGNSRVWYDSSPFYYPLVFLRDNIILVMMLICMFMWILISWRYLNNVISYMNTMVQASESIMKGSQENIVMPDVMRNIENEFNLIKERNEKDRMTAREAVQRKNDLIVYLAHDLKTPLTSVIGYLSLLRDEPDIPEGARQKYIGVAAAKAERLEDLINEFFEITRFNLTAMEVEYENISLSLMLEQITFEFEPVLKEKNLAWKLDIEQNVNIVCDPDKLERVFENLIKNAVNYSYSDTQILFAMRRRDGYVEITVENHGRHIPEEKLSRIFERFYRIDKARSTGTGGTGLGLAIAKDIVEYHKGTITAESEAENIRFTVVLPLRHEAV